MATILRRAFPTLVRKLHDPDEFFGDEVLAALSKVYPAKVLGWVKGVEWRKSDVPLANIQMAQRPGGRDQGKVDGIAQALDDGRSMERVVLVKTPGNGKYEIADGYHRTLAFDRAGRTTIPAYVGKVNSDDGPWQREMHDAKLNKAALPILVRPVAKDEPTSTDVHVDVPLGSDKKRKRKKGEPAEPDLTVLKTSDDEQRIVYGIVLEPDTEDSQGDVISKDDVELAAHRYLYQQGLAIGDQHRGLAPNDVRPVESFIAPCDFQMGGQVVKAGSWVMAAHIPDDDLWAQVKKGDKGAWSIGGTGKRRPLTEALAKDDLAPAPAPVHVHVSFADGAIAPVVHNHMPEHGEHTVNVHVPEQAAPIVNNHIEAAPAPEVHTHHEIHVEQPKPRAVVSTKQEDGSTRHVAEN